MSITPPRWAPSDPTAACLILERQGIEYVHAGLFDTEGVFREKRLPASLCAEYLHRGWSFIDALPYWGPNDTVRADRPYQHAPCALDPASLRPYPFEPNSALIVADYTAANRALSPRALLGQQIARAADLGLEACGGSEFEFILLAETPASLSAKGYANLTTHAPENRCWAGLYPATGAHFIRDYVDSLGAGDVPLHHVCAELGPGCLEAALPTRALLNAADDAALFKLFTKAFAITRGLTASFMAQLSDDHPGLGGHPIISLRDVRSGQWLLHADDGNGLSALAHHFIAGVLQGLPDLMPMLASTVNAYRRYVPGNWAPRSATWGLGNYTCGLRAITGAPADTRLELRLPGADMNPHLAFAMLLGAGLNGIEQGLTPPPASRDIGREQVHPEFGPLPRTLLEAAERMQRSPLARGLFGASFVDHFCANCLHEDTLMRRHVSAFERQRYFHHV
ncbi:MAG: hypothetical protein EXR83_01945 [Gammaproteobacteria bacterium]|nr:hypothetical protein [Gammaproteobacteria bacterium]